MSALIGIINGDTVLTTAVARLLFGRGSSGFHQWPVTFLLVVAHYKEGNNDGNPIEVIREDRAIGCGVLPPEQRVEDSPSSATVDLCIAALFLWSAT